MIVKSDISPSGWLTVLGIRDRTAQAYDAQTGKLIWKSPSLDSNTIAGSTGAPVIFGDQVFVPLTSGEEGVARSTRRAQETVPLGRPGKLREVGFLALYLASSASDYMTGQTILLDGGWASK